MSFRLKTVIGIAVIEVVLLTIIVISSLNYLKTSNERQFTERAQTTARLLATMTTDAVIAMDLATLDTLIAESLKNPDIAYARIRARTGAVLSQGGDTAILDGLEPAPVAGEMKDDRIDISFPIEVAGEKFGHVDLGIRAAELTTTMQDARRWMLSLAAIEILLVAIFGVVLGSILTGQLKDIQQGARRVAGGELGVQVPVRGNDELADTARSFNTMSTELARSAKSLEEARAQAENRRMIAESTLQDAIASLSDGIIIADPTKRALQFNAAFVRGHAGALDDRREWTLRDLDQALTPFIETFADGAATVAELARGASGPEAGAATRNFENAVNGARWTVRYRDGSTFLYSTSGMANGGVVIVASDMTAIYDAEEKARQLQREAHQGQKLEAIGTLAGGIAHELNTPIQFIGDNLNFIGDACVGILDQIAAYQTLLDSLADGAAPDDLQRRRESFEAADIAFVREELPSAIEQSADGIRQMANIVLAMKEFAHPASKEKSSVDLNRSLERALLVSRNEWKYVARVERDFTEPAPTALVNEGELNQVLLNVIVNAAHAIKETERADGVLSVRTYENGDKVAIAVTDNGTGIPLEIQDRVFEQFFTTKDVGKGTGQGLALCNEFIKKRNGGNLRFVTAPGAGTTFFIELPKAPAAA